MKHRIAILALALFSCLRVTATGEFAIIDRGDLNLYYYRFLNSDYSSMYNELHDGGILYLSDGTFYDLNIHTGLTVFGNERGLGSKQSTWLCNTTEVSAASGSSVSFYNIGFSSGANTSFNIKNSLSKLSFHNCVNYGFYLSSGSTIDELYFEGIRDVKLQNCIAYKVGAKNSSLILYPYEHANDGWQDSQVCDMSFENCEVNATLPYYGVYNEQGISPYWYYNMSFENSIVTSSEVNNSPDLTHALFKNSIVRNIFADYHNMEQCYWDGYYHDDGIYEYGVSDVDEYSVIGTDGNPVGVNSPSQNRRYSRIDHFEEDEENVKFYVNTDASAEEIVSHITWFDDLFQSRIRHEGGYIYGDASSQPYFIISKSAIPLGVSDIYHWASTSYEVRTFIESTQINKLAAPTISIEGEVLTISDENNNTIYYTVDGSDPTKSGIVYTGAVTLTSDCSVKAVTKKDGCISSEVVGANVKLTKPCANPIFTLEGTRLNITSSTPGATIFYTIDGSEPTENSTVCPIGGIQLTHNCVVKAFAQKTGFYDSEIKSFSVDFFTTATPQAWVESLAVVLSSETEGSVIYYTLDGSDPTPTSSRYNQPIAIIGDMTIKAFASKYDMNDSDILTFNVTKSDFVCKPVKVSFDSGRLIMSCESAGTEIHYTLDGSEPTRGSALYEGPVSLSSNCTVKAIAYGPNVFPSEVTVLEVIAYKVDSPVIIMENLHVKLSCATEGAKIYYTTNGDNPDTDGIYYISPIPFKGDMTIKSCAKKSGLITSPIVEKSFVASEWVCSKPVISIPSTVDSDNTLKLTITCDTDATIYYTLDGSDPSSALSSRKIYQGDEKLTYNCKVKAVAVSADRFMSDVASLDVVSFVVAKPSLTVEDLKVKLTCPTSQSKIYYTLDGSDPSENGLLYTSPLLFTSDMTIRFMAQKQDFISSEIVDETIRTSDWTCATPVLTIEDKMSEANTYKVTITCVTSDAVIYYTLDGSDPAVLSPSRHEYQDEISISHNCIVKAIAVKPGLFQSEMRSTEISSFTVAAPSVRIEDLKIKMLCSTDKAKIYYTLDGSNPLTYGLLYINPLPFSSDVTIRLCAKKSDFNDSEIVEQSLSVAEWTCADPQITLTISTQEEDLSTVDISTTTKGATIYYTLEGSDPREESSARKQFDSSITLTDNCIVKAVAVKTGFFSSSVVEQTAKFIRTSAPQYEFDNGKLSIMSATPGAKIFYEIGGKEPTMESSRYEAPLILTDNRTVTAIAVSDDYLDSKPTSYTPEYFTCEDVSINYDGRSFSLTVSDGSSIHYTTDGTRPDSNSPTFSGNRIQLKGLCKIRAVAMKSNFNNSTELEYDVPAYYNGGKAYVAEAGSLERAFVWCGRNGISSLSVEGNLNGADLKAMRSFKALHHLDMENAILVDKNVPDEVFSYMDLYSVVMPNGIESVGSRILVGNSHLGSLVWNNDVAVPSDVLGSLRLPNMLLYVNTSEVADREIYHNVIVNGEAENISLVDADERGCFFCKRVFVAKKISYVHNFGMQSVLSGCQGWEALSLPFDVESVTHAVNGNCMPFAAYDPSSDDKPFWLCLLTSTGFMPASTIEANKPYILCMPNNPYYADEYNLGGEITFAAENVVISTTVVDTLEYGNHLFIPNYTYVGASDDVISLNIYDEFDEYKMGSLFVPNRREAKPFEPYFVMKYAGEMSRAVHIDGNTDNVDDVLLGDVASQSYVKDGKLFVFSSSSRMCRLYDISGKVVKTISLYPGWNNVDGLGKGIYIMDGNKYVIR